jgi:hypothetical protein
MEEQSVVAFTAVAVDVVKLGAVSSMSDEPGSPSLPGLFLKTKLSRAVFKANKFNEPSRILDT